MTHANQEDRRAKILATLGPACHDEDSLRQLIDAGINGVRLNFSHGEYSDHKQMIHTTRQVAQEMGKPIAIVQDLQGPKLRTGENKDNQPIELKPGDMVSLSTGQGESTSNVIHVNYKPLARDVSPDDRILIDDGRIELKVVASDGRQQVETIVLVGGELKAHKGINLPGISLSAAAMTDKDQKDLQFGMTHGIDMVAMSFVSRREDVLRLCELVRDIPQEALPHPVISKLERQEAIDNLDGILQESDGVMVARGDLGVEVAAERVPSLQKMIISRANSRSKLVITATQMLDSMIRNPRPTRAESSDVANAVFDGSDVLMLSGETAIGNHPIRSVETMARIILDAEAHTAEWGFQPGDDERSKTDDAAATTQAASELAQDRDAVAVGVFTRSGRTALLMSKTRPKMPILGFTPEEKTYNRMALFWGVDPQLIPMADSVEAMIGHMEQALVRTGRVDSGDKVVLVASLPVGAMGPANMTYLHTIGEDIKSPLTS